MGWRFSERAGAGKFLQPVLEQSSKQIFLKTNELICSGGESVSPKGLAGGGVGKRIGYVEALDPLRGVAALAVAFFHFACNGWVPLDGWVARWGYYGHLGVHAFLVISGFVVPYSMWGGGYRVSDFLPFVGRRLTRIYPPFLVSVVLMGVVNRWWPNGDLGPMSGGDLLAHLFFLNDLLGRPWLIAVYWTLALEVQFYLFVGLAWRWVASGSSWVFGSGAVLGVGAGLIFSGQGWLLGKFAYFLLGMGLFREHVRLDSRVVSGGFLLGLLGVIGWRDGWVVFMVVGLPVAAKLLAPPVPVGGRFLGKISYSLYLFHLLTGMVFLNVLGPWVSSVFWRSWLILPALGISVAGAWLGYFLFEKPAIRWSRMFAYRVDGLKREGG